MQHMNLLSTVGEKIGLASFASKLFSAIGISVFEERQSENYVGGHYFKGSDNYLVFSVSLSDERNPEDFPYWINIAASVHTQEDLNKAVIHLIQERLSPAGFRFVLLKNFGKINESRIEY